MSEVLWGWVIQLGRVWDLPIVPGLKMAARYRGGLVQTFASNFENSRFFRTSDAPGVEMRTVAISRSGWNQPCTGFDFLVADTWVGEIFHCGRQRVMEPGTLVCSHFGEVVVARRVRVAGNVTVLSLDESLLRRIVGERWAQERPLRFRPFAAVSTELACRFRDIVTAMRAGFHLMEVQARLWRFVTRALDELQDRAPAPRIPTRLPGLAVEKLRTDFERDPTRKLDLGSLAEECGMSRFQALRAFKRRYGLPPHAYQLSMRLGLAGRALRQGLQPAQVAAEYAFVDQSHLTRHFKRAFGVTPGRYARISGETRLAEERALTG